MFDYTDDPDARDPLGVGDLGLHLDDLDPTETDWNSLVHPEHKIPAQTNVASDRSNANRPHLSITNPGPMDTVQALLIAGLSCQSSGGVRDGEDATKGLPGAGARGGARSHARHARPTQHHDRKVREEMDVWDTMTPERGRRIFSHNFISNILRIKI